MTHRLSLRNHRQSRGKKRLQSLESLEPRLVLDGTVVFNEIMYNPPGEFETLEWIELHNQQGVDMDISGWSLAGGVDFVFPEGTIVPGAGHVVIASDPAALAGATGFATAMGPYSGRLANNGEQLELRNNNDRQVDVLDYNDNNPWPVAPDGSGVTLSKLNQNGASSDPNTWTNSRQLGGTPGQDNFPTGVKGVVLSDVAGGGVSAEGTLLEVGQSDPRWMVSTTGQPAVMLEPDATWAESPDTARWIGAGPDAPAGSPVTYSTTFDLTGLDTSTATLSIRVVAADQLIDVLLNGESQGLSSLGATRFPRRATAIESGFVEGSNTLEIVTGNFGGTSAVLVELSGAGTTLPVPPDPFVGLIFNEVSGASDANRFAEIINLSDGPIELSGLEVRASSGASFAFGAGVLNPGELAAATTGQNDFDFDANDVLILAADSGTTIIDGARVEDALRGRSPQHDMRWLNPDMATPGQANSFAINDNVVINEIFYRAPTIPRVPGMPPTYDETTYVAFDSTWRYTKDFNFGAADQPVNPGPDWASQAHPADSVSWFEGLGPIGVGRIDRSVPRFATTLTSPRLSTNFITTYYFETEFGLTQEQIDAMDELQLEHGIDDGAIFYLNGDEVFRVNMPDGAATFDTLASSEVDRAVLSEPVTIAKDSLVALPAMNRLSVEVHQNALDSEDIALAAQLIGRDLVDVGFPTSPPVKPADEWMELYNRSSTETVDLTNWRFTDGISFDFEPGTQIAPGQFLIVSNDPAGLLAKHPSLDPAIVLGPFSGTLSDRGERIELSDPHDNPADEVDYRDAGRWPRDADGERSSLELRDPDADNSLPEAWAASDERGRSSWQTYTYQGTGQKPLSGDPDIYSEFLFGLLDAGEILIDDISVLENPGTADAQQLIQNGSFEDDTVGGQPAKWRLVGTQQGSVEVDPDDPSNQVVHLRSTGHTSHEHNNAGTTLKRGEQILGRRDIDEDATYEISFRAKWLTGSNALHTRLYFNRAAKKTLLQVPEIQGTPGMPNSTHVENLGPTYEGFVHTPVVPDPGEDVTVTVAAFDPDDVGSMTLWYSVESGEFNSVEMTAGSNGRYTATLPGQDAESIVQFYVEGTDGLGATSTFPAQGADSRALYKVQDGEANFNTGVHNFRIIMTPSDRDFFHERTNVMGNNPVGVTVVYDEREVFYDVTTRLKGSQRGRNQPVRVGFVVRFDPTHLFRGVYETVGVDRSGAGNEFSQKEILVKHGIHHAGNIPSPYDDLIHVIAPRDSQTGSAMLMPGFRTYYLETAYENGEDGTDFEYELIYYPTTTVGGDPEGLKIPEPDSVVGGAMADHGPDPEAYRWHWLIKNNREADDYHQMIETLRALGQRAGEQFDADTQRLLDVDEWLRAFAVQVVFGIGDNYATNGAPWHNAHFYTRPDGKTLYFPYDMDFTFSEGATSGLVTNSELRKLVANVGNEHMYMGHVLDIVTTTFNNDYMDRWIDHYQGKLTSNQNYQSFKTYITRRNESILGRMPDEVPFEITTAGPLDVGDSTVATIGGTGWVNVRELRVTGNDQPIDVTWTDVTTWEANLPVNQSTSKVTLEAYDFQGALLGTSEIDVTSTAANPVADSLRITEISYNPADPTPDELSVLPGLTNDDFEFIEVQNVAGQAINLLSSRFVDGVEFTFPLALLQPGERGVVVGNADAFSMRYGDDVNVLGQFEGALQNSGEILGLIDSQGTTVVEFQYEDDARWPQSADGVGATLQLIDPAGTPADQFGKPGMWRGSTEFGGSPGAAGVDPTGVVINEVLTNTDTPDGPTDSIELFNMGSAAVDVSGWYLSDSVQNMLKYPLPAGTTIPAGGYVVFDESHFNPTPDNPGPNHFALSGDNGDDVWLVIGDGQGGVTSLVDDVHFGPALSGESFGRIPDGSGRLAPTSSLTLGSANSGSRVGPVVFSEINYNPGEPTAEAMAAAPDITSGDLEYIEVFNSSSAAVDVTGWQVTGGIGFDFPDGMQIGPGSSLLVISFDPQDPDNAPRVAAMRAQYSLNAGVALAGGYQGRLNDDGEIVRLRRSVPSADGGEAVLVLEDEVIYEDTAPWPTAADGTGATLARVAVDTLGNAANSWTAGDPSPGSTSFVVTLVGDVNEDGQTDQLDLTAILQAGKYMTGQAAAYAEGDFNGDGLFDQMDLVLALQSGSFANANFAARDADATELVDDLFARF